MPSHARINGYCVITSPVNAREAFRKHLLAMMATAKTTGELFELKKIYRENGFN